MGQRYSSITGDYDVDHALASVRKHIGSIHTRWMSLSVMQLQVIPLV